MESPIHVARRGGILVELLKDPPTLFFNDALSILVCDRYHACMSLCAAHVIQESDTSTTLMQALCQFCSSIGAPVK